MRAMCKLFPEAGSHRALVQLLPSSETYLLTTALVSSE